MSIEKRSTLKHIKRSYTQLDNETINAIESHEVIGVYTYLCCKPENWIICKEHLRKRFKIGYNKLSKILSELKKLGLYETYPVKDKTGKISHWETSLFWYIDKSLIKNSIPKSNDSINEEKPIKPSTNKDQNQSHEIHAYGNDRLYNKDINNKDIKNNIKSKSNLLNNNVLELFNLFWLAYPKKRQKKRALKIWEKNRLWEKYEEIMQGLENLKKNCYQWVNQKFRPDPDNFLNDERWNDAPVTGISDNNPTTTQQETNEPAFDIELHDKLAKQRNDEKMKSYIEEQKKNNPNFGNNLNKLENILKNRPKNDFKVPR